MTIQEALKEVTSKHKWYVCCDDKGNRLTDEESRIRANALRIIAGKAKPETIKSFFQKFGYDVDVKMEITKKRWEKENTQKWVKKSLVTNARKENANGRVLMTKRKEKD